MEEVYKLSYLEAWLVTEVDPVKSNSLVLSLISDMIYF